MNCYRYLISLGIVAASMQAVYSQSKLSDTTAMLQQDSTVVIGKLPNGLTYYIQPNRKPEGKVELRLVVRAGSLEEDDNQQGIAHFVEHMLFNGLKHFPENEMIHYLQKIGVPFGSDLNANTSWYQTTYQLPIPTDAPENLPTAFQIVRDWADGAMMTTVDITNERKIILEELRARMGNANTRLLRQYFPYLMNGARYAFRLPVGKADIVANADPELIRKYYKDWYRPDLMGIIVVGDITVPEAKGLVTKYLGTLKTPANKRSRIAYRVKPYSGKKAMVITDPETTNYAFKLVYPAESRKRAKTIADFRQNLVDMIAYQCLNRRLTDQTQKADPPFVSASLHPDGDIGSITLSDKALQLDIRPSDNFSIAIHAAIKEMLSAAKFGFAADEIRSAVSAIRSLYENSFQQRENVYSSTLAGVYAAAFSSGDIIPGIANQLNYVERLLPGITSADIQKAISQLGKAPEKYFALIVGPSKGTIVMPSEKELSDILSHAFHQVPEREQRTAQDTVLLKHKPLSGKIVSERVDKKLGATTYTLSNGVLVTIKHTDFESDKVLFSGLKKGGTNNYGAKDAYNLMLVNDMTNVIGIGDLTPTALSDFLSNKQVAVSLGMSGISNTINGSCNVADLETMLQLTYLKLTAPRKDTNLFKGWLSKLNNFIPQMKADPGNLYQDSLSKVLYEGNPLAPIVIPSLKSLHEINLDSVLDIYRREFCDAAGFHFFFVGSIDSQKLKPLLELYLGSLPADGAVPVFRDNGLRAAKGTKRFNFHKGKGDKAAIFEMYHGDISYTADFNLKATLLAEVMNIDIVDTLREKMQLIYSGGAAVSVQQQPYPYFNFSIQMPCKPENAEIVMKALDDQIKRYERDGVSKVNLDKVKKAMTERYYQGLKQNGTWLAQLMSVYFWKQDENNFLNFLNNVNGVTAGSLKEVAEKLFEANRFYSIWYPEDSKL